MGSTLLKIACLIPLTLLLSGAGRRDASKDEMRFGAEAAERGLWREAAFRWERVLKGDPGNARLRNNLAVAYESLGQFDLARKEYEEARRLDPERKEIRNNFEAFRALCKTIKTCPGEDSGPSPSPTPAAVEPSGSATPEPGPGSDVPAGGSPGGPPPGGF
jgi:tetratricopeptide (TPR) repeat protein